MGRVVGRLDDPKDWVRLEIVAALERNVPVIPALVGGAKMPLASDLPDPLSKLTRRQAIEITHSGFHSDVDRLIRGLEKILPPEAKKSRKLRTAQTAGKAASTQEIVASSNPRPIVLRVIIASGSELQEDMDALELYFRQRNDMFVKRGLYFEIVRWETFLGTMSETHRQIAYADAVRTCDIFVGLFFTKVGKFVEEEFDIAFRDVVTDGRPYVWVYFKDADVVLRTGNALEELKSLLKFQEKLKSLGLFWGKYNSIEDLKLQFHSQLEKLTEARSRLRNNELA